MTETSAQQSAQQIVGDWNRCVPPGSPVLLRKDDGTRLQTKTISKAAVIGGTPVVWLKDVRGCYALDRITPIASGTNGLIFDYMDRSAIEVSRLITRIEVLEAKIAGMEGQAMSKNTLDTYIGSKSCGCVVGLVKDDPEHKDDTKDGLMVLVNSGLTIERVPYEVAWLAMGKECTHGEKQS